MSRVAETRAATEDGQGRDGASSWSNGPGQRYARHRHEYDKMIVVEHGSIAFGLGSESIELSAGDRLELPAGTEHDALVGADGVRCLEIHRPVGTFVAPRKTGARTGA